MATRGQVKSVEFKQAALTATSTNAVPESLSAPNAQETPTAILKSAGAVPSVTAATAKSPSRRFTRRHDSLERRASSPSVHRRGNDSASRPGLRRFFERDGSPDEVAPRNPLSPDRRSASKNRRIDRHGSSGLGIAQHEHRCGRAPRRRPLAGRLPFVNEQRVRMLH